jgi:hypothetical protein
MTSQKDTPHARIKQNLWDLEAVLPLNHRIPSHYFSKAPAGVVENVCCLLSRDVFSEGDAQALYNSLIQRQDELSAAFLAMLNLWLADELKHYEALRRTYHCISGISFTEMDDRFGERVHEIQPIEQVLADEFTILVTMMFDEIGSVYSYRRDLREYYCHFGSAIQKMGHHLVKDEGMHFNNAAELLLIEHHHRLDEVEALLQNIAALEDRLGKYYKTFFLDHAQEQFRFPPHFNQVIIRLILARLGLGQQPTQTELRELWQWVPTGYQLIPILPSQTASLLAEVEKNKPNT